MEPGRMGQIRDASFDTYSSDPCEVPAAPAAKGKNRPESNRPRDSILMRYCPLCNRCFCDIKTHLKNHFKNDQ